MKIDTSFLEIDLPTFETQEEASEIARVMAAKTGLEIDVVKIFGQRHANDILGFTIMNAKVELRDTLMRQLYRHPMILRCSIVDHWNPPWYN